MPADIVNGEAGLSARNKINDRFGNSDVVDFPNNISIASSLLITEETSWTPALEFGGASVGITYAAQEGKFIDLVSRIRFFRFRVTLTNKGSSVGDASFMGLPAGTPSSGEPNNFQTVMLALNITSLSTHELHTIMTTGGVSVGLINSTTGVNIDNTSFTNTSDIIVQGFYIF